MVGGDGIMMGGVGSCEDCLWGRDPSMGERWMNTRWWEGGGSIRMKLKVGICIDWDPCMGE